MSQPFCPAHPNPNCPKKNEEGRCEYCGFDFENEYLLAEDANNARKQAAAIAQQRMKDEERMRQTECEASNQRSMNILDVSQSGVRVYRIQFGDDKEIPHEIAFYVCDKSIFEDFVLWAKGKGILNAWVIGVITPGFVDEQGTIKLSRATGWNNYPLKQEILRHSPTEKVYILNDAEACLMAHTEMYEPPVMQITLNESPGFAISNQLDELLRPPDGMNFDVGEVPLPIDSTWNRVWWALGISGLEELKNRHGFENGLRLYGQRLGGFLATLSGLFRPKTIVLCGEIIDAHWPVIREEVVTTFDKDKPDWLGEIRFTTSPHANGAPALGMAKYAQRKIGAL